MRTIRLTQGQVAIVDDDDFESLSRYKWFADWDSDIEGYYAKRALPRVDGKQGRAVRMHREIMGVLDAGRNVKVDHINNNTLDNRRENLRVTDNRGNLSNQRRKKEGRCTSRFIGVTYDARGTGRWVAHFVANGKVKHLGRFIREEDAGAAYQKALAEWRQREAA